MSTAPLWAAAAALLVAPFFLAFRSGGYGLPAAFPGGQGQLIVAGGALALLALLAVVAPWPPLPGGLSLAALAALLGLGLWTGLSTQWTHLQDNAVLDTDRVVMYGIVFALGLAVLRVPAIRRLVPVVLLTGILVVSLYALAGRLLPDIVHQAGGYTRLRQPLTYWNALGILTGFGVLLGVALASDETRSRIWRSLACAAAVPCGLAAYLTLSRAAAASVAAGLVMGLVVRRARTNLVAALCALFPIVVMALLLNGFPEVLSLGSNRSAQVSQGAQFLAIAVAATLAAGVAYALLSRSRLAAGELPLGSRVRAAIAVAVVPLVLGAGMAVAAHGKETTDVPTGASRFARTETNRGHYWRVSLAAFRRHPLNGIGSSSFEAEWTRHRGKDQAAHDAHSLYVETLAELGLVGALLLLAFFAAVATGVVRAARAAPRDPLVAAAAAVLAAFAIHAGLDWDWEMPAVTLIPLIMAAAVLSAPGRRRVQEQQQ